MVLQKFLVTFVVASIFIIGCGRPAVHPAKESHQSRPAIPQQATISLPERHPEKADSPTASEEVDEAELDFVPDLSPLSLPRFNSFPASWRNHNRFDRDGMIEKKCEKCRRQVPNYSAPGMCCPHCGVRWDVEKKSDRSASGFPF